MGNGIRGRIFTWLLIAIVPVLLIALVSTTLIESRLEERFGADIANVRRLEANRISQQLETFARDAERAARTPHLHTVIEQVTTVREGGMVDVMIQGGGFEEFDPTRVDPLGEIAESIGEAAMNAGTAVLEVRVVGAQGESLGQSSGYTWEPEDDEIIRGVLDGDRTRFGRAYRVGVDDDRVGAVSPIRNSGGKIVGALQLELTMTPIVEMLEAHKNSGRTSEAYLVQRTSDQMATFISPLRFRGDAAFEYNATGDPDAPINKAFEAPEGAVINGLDYRGEESVFAIETIEETGWGLAIKMDTREAFGISRSIRTLVLLGSMLATIALVLGWALLLRPLVRRIRQTALAAERVAAGDYTSRIDDRMQDEIGEVARGIDRLAADLEFDIRMRNDAERRLRYQATHDELTNIYNRQHMTSVIRESLESGEDRSVSLLFLDLDDFKLVNDLWGHAVGDEVLAAVANRLRRLVGDDVLISRWGGDEFTVVLNNADTATINTLAHRVRSLFAQPINTTVGPHPVTCSVGVATAFSGDDLDQLLHDADAKMFEEKQANRTSRMIEPETARLVEMALADGRLEAFYQPIVSLQSATETRIEAVEALVRIRSNDGTLHQPSEFLPEVLSHRYAREIDRTVAMMALRDLAEWRESGLVSRGFLLTLNLSPASMRDASLSQSMLELVTNANIEPEVVVLELSEEGDDLPAAVAAELQEFGFQFAVDDLGLKRSNFDRLTAGGIDIAKIDRRWLDDAVVLEALVRTCQDRDMNVIGEGVETMEQLAMLYRHGVRLCQGYLIARPMSSTDLTDLLSSSNPEPEAAKAVAAIR